MTRNYCLSEMGGRHVTGSMDLHLCCETEKSSFIRTMLEFGYHHEVLQEIHRISEREVLHVLCEVL